MKKSGFTLAEVLITLVIIGVIAAMTIPTLMNNTNSQEFRAALKKAISALNQAVTMQYALEGTLISDYTSAENVVQNVFSSRLNVINTSAGNDTSTWAGTAAGCTTNAAVFITADGIAYCIQNFGTAGGSTAGACDNAGNNPCATTVGTPTVLIDVNGLKKPNTLTTDSSQPKDIYEAHLYAQRVVPFKDATQQVMYDAHLN